jgi:very-short-patch-repair endonuclease
MTPAEAILWDQLRRRRFPGHRFRRQHPMGAFIADFFCHSLRLVIELDGEVHDTQTGYDALRDAWFREQGYSVVRFRNSEVMENLEQVMDAIACVAGAPPQPLPVAQTARSGEGLAEAIDPMISRGP